MLDPTQIKNVVDNVLVIEQENKGYSELNFFDRKKKKREFYPGFFMNVQAMEEIRTHAIRGTYPARIIENRAPNMTDEERKYVEANYKQITLPVFVDYINTIKRAFSDNNWSLEFPNDDGNEKGLRYYVDKAIANTSVKMSLESYIKSVITSVKAIDPNGCIVVKPEKIKTETIGDEQVMSAELLDPVPYYYSCEQLRAFEEGEYYLFLTHEHSEVDNGGKKERSGFIYELYDRKGIYRIIQTGNKQENQYDIIEYYIHEKNAVPVKRLEGVPEVYDGDITWISPFSYAVPLLDDALIDANMLRGVKATTMFPYRIAIGNVCEGKMTMSNGDIETCGGKGWYKDHAADGRVIQCTECGGSGLKNRISPQGLMLLNPETGGDNAELKMNQPPYQIVSPAVDVPQFIRKEIAENIRDAKKILHIRDSSSKVNGNEDLTATEVVIDEKALYSFVKPISDQEFEMYEFILEWISIERYGEVRPFILTWPITFDFKTEYDYLMEISMAIKNGLPPFVVHTIVLKYLKTLFYNQLESASAFNIIVKADRLLTMDNDEVALKVSKGIIDKWEVVLHDSAVTFVMDLLQENRKFFNQEEAVQIQQLQDKAKEVAASITSNDPMNPQSLVDRITQIGGQPSGTA